MATQQHQPPASPTSPTSSSPPSRPQRPQKIRPLPKEVVDRIAAGEVVQRPVSVVKELIENCLDADSTIIDVQTKRGGLDSISVTDNGYGISPRDLPLACTRFATSKLVEVDDLKSIRTFGFRGEALASASMVARVGIVSRVRPRNNAAKNPGECSSSDDDDTSRNQNCAFKMHYRDGAPNPQTNPTLQPKPSAGREGTAITVQDLFYNIPSRRRALDGSKRSEREEYDRILNVAQRYAVHEARNGVGFVCRGSGTAGGKGKKSKTGFGGGNHTDLNTQSLASVKRLQERRKKRAAASSVANSKNVSQQQTTEEEQFAATNDVISHIFGNAVSRELLPLTAGEGDLEAVSLAALQAMLPKKKNAKNIDDTNNKGSPLEDSQDQVENKGDENSLSGNKKSFTNSLLEEMMMGVNDISDKATTSTIDQEQSLQSTKSSHTQPSSKFAFAYRAIGLITNGSYSCPKSSSAFLLFINDRLVESSSLRRAIDSVYSDTLPKGGKPFIYLSLELPGPHVDVNVHPTKREVALLHEDKLCDAVSRVVRGVIAGASTSRTFSVAHGGRLLPKEKKKNSCKEKIMQVVAMEGSGMEESVDDIAVKTRNEDSDVKSMDVDGDGKSLASTINMEDAPRESILEEEAKSIKKTPKKRNAAAAEDTSSSIKKRAYDPSRLVRTNRSLPVGALEPFLVSKEDRNFGSNNKDTSTVQHKPGCPLANNFSGNAIDMNMPGAFAMAICRCQVERAESLPPAFNHGTVVRNAPANKNMAHPKKITPTECDYESIIDLRNAITTENYQSLNESLRSSTYVGAVSRSRSLIQCGFDLLMINHIEMARELFYQIALMKFSQIPMAALGRDGVDAMAVIGSMLQFEEDMNSLKNEGKASLGNSRPVKVNKTNMNLAKQATTCLVDNASMLEEYFSIKLKKIKVRNSQQQPVTSVRITGLPILLDGHFPQPHGLPLFLLRLATEVDWTNEELCFKGVCTELASFYSELPFAPSDIIKGNPSDNHNADTAGSEGKEVNSELVDNDAKKHVQHTLFPAISYLLVPPKRFADSGDVVIKLANLNSLYKVFERC